MKETEKNETIKDAYKLSKNIYDDVLSRQKWWSRLYIAFFWGNVDDVEIAGKVLDMIPADFSGTLLDVPVGTAVFTLEKYRKLPNAQITCLDYSEDMLSQAQARFTRNQLPNIRCMQGDVGSLPFSDETYDIVLSMNGFHAFPDKEKAFSETARVLKKGGIFCGCFYIKGECRRTDFVVNHVLARKGWFTPPFQTLPQLKKQLEQEYSAVELFHEKAMVYFRCVK
ncbi:MAG: class I SAM-dependent methyltransferase [Lachnospiraceae bacterium]|nr:class I SAM-dependent methyltransferase [Lachnospiraceae bacterium]